VASPLISIQNAVKHSLIEDKLEKMFQQDLAWHSPKGVASSDVGGTRASVIAELSGVAVWLVADSDLLNLSLVEKELAKRSSERLVIVDRGDRYEWRWPEPTRTGSIRVSTHLQQKGEAPTWLVQRLATLRFELADQGRLTVLDVRQRLRMSFATEKVTDNFFNEFRKIHSNLAGTSDSIGSIEGIAEYSERRWYASILLNRLMFLYFLEKKGFLDNDPNYLRTRLRMVQEELGADEFYGFYADFLIPLFHDAIGSRETPTSGAFVKIIGDVPYLNGGVFARHPLEAAHQINVPDAIFEDVFDVFDKYKWHLDDRPGQSGEEINPDILGHIFEKYVNQKGEGAFYTPQDVTAWMSTRTVGGWVLDRISDLDYPIAKFLRSSGRTYIPAENFVGESELLTVKPEVIGDTFPELNSPEAQEWSTHAHSGCGLPSETWWEVRDRINHARRLESWIKSIEVISTNELLEKNLDVFKVCTDIIETLNADQLTSLWISIRRIKLIDPTCGSGAFLIAAMSAVEELLEKCVNRAEICIDSRSGVPTDLGDLAAMSALSRTASIRRHLIVNNIYGADLAAEAVEIARLRMYLSLVSLYSTRSELVPLPDLEFNLASGNLLVGVNTVADLEQSIGSTLMGVSEVDRLKGMASKLGEAIREFQSRVLSGFPTGDQKSHATILATELQEQLDSTLWAAVSTRSQSIEEWRSITTPLNYLSAFPEVMLDGGFDLVLGNPPYIRASDVYDNYEPVQLRTRKCPDIYAHCVERAFSLVNANGWVNLVLPYNFAWSEDYRDLRSHLLDGQSWNLEISNFAIRPDCIFAGVAIRNSILLGAPGKGSVRITDLQHWVPAYRSALFATLRFGSIERPELQKRFNRIGSNIADSLGIFDLNKATITTVKHSEFVLHTRKVGRYFMPVAPIFPQTLNAQGELVAGKVTTLHFASEEYRNEVLAIYASRLGFLWWQATGDDFDITGWNFSEFPQVSAIFDSVFASEAGREIAERLANNPLCSLWNFNAQKWIQTFDPRPIYDSSDNFVHEFLTALGLSHRWDEFEAWYWRHMKATGEATGSRRGLTPFASGS
jgi:hypothetical protein